MFLRFVLAVAIAAAPLAAPAPSLAQPVNTEAGARALISDLARWVAPYRDTMTELGDYSLLVIGGLEKVAQGDLTEKEAKAWKADLDRRGEVLRAQTQALTPMSDVLKARMNGLGPTGRRQVEAFVQLPGRTHEFMRDTLAFKDRVAPLVVRVAGGDDDARMELVARTLEGTRLMLRRENAMVELMISVATREAHPQAALGRAVIAGNDVFVELLLVQEKVLLGEEIDLAAARKRIDGLIADGRRHANAVGPYADKLIAELRAGPKNGLVDTIIKAMGTFKESAALEVTYLETLEAVAQTVKPGMSAEVFDSWDLEPIDPLVNRRVELMNQRAAMMSGL